jgi:tRNA threonylcarbamoyladenosine biosynthesis protein TsaE
MKFFCFVFLLYVSFFIKVLYVSKRMCEVLQSIINGLAEMEAFSITFSKQLCPGSIVLFYGDMGAGKTTFTRFLVAALGGDVNNVSSPTFSLVQDYDGKTPIRHLDLYRLNDAEIMDLDLDYYLSNNRYITVIEWAERLNEDIPKDAIKVSIEFLPDLPLSRRLTVSRYDDLIGVNS